MDNLKHILTLFRNVLIAALIVAIPFAAFYLYASARPAAFSDSYYEGLQTKYDRLCQVSGQKIVIIGGSATAFAIDSDLVEAETGYPTVNFGLYAAIGIKPMMDLALHHISEGDIVILLPELSSQTYSDYTGYEYLLYAMEGRTDIAFSFGTSYAKYFLHNYPTYLKNAKKALQNPSDSSTVYAASSFGENGDIIYPRPENIMALGYSTDNLPEIDTGIITDSFTDMINSFTKKAEKKGASVYFGFPPINNASVSSFSSSDYASFTDTLSEKLNARLLNSLENSIMDPGYFYDSNYHLNDTGSIYYSLLISNDINRLLGSVRENQTAFPTPVPLSVIVATPVEVDGFSCLETEEKIYITGITDALKDAESITIPDTLDGRKVAALQGSIFDGCTSLKEIIIECSSLPEVGNYLLDGTNSDIKIKVPKDLYNDYITDYFWGYYSQNLE